MTIREMLDPKSLYLVPSWDEKVAVLEAAYESAGRPPAWSHKVVVTPGTKTRVQGTFRYEYPGEKWYSVAVKDGKATMQDNLPSGGGYWDRS